jgi:hypothetical protein
MKNNPSFARLIRWQSQSFLLWRHLFLPFALFLFIGGYAVSQTTQLSTAPANISVWDVALVAFGGPGADDNSLVRMLVWFMPYLLFFYFIGDFAYGELAQRGYWVLPLVGSRFRWWVSKTATLSGFVLAYTWLYLGGVLLIPALRLAGNIEGFSLWEQVFPTHPEINGWVFLGWVFGSFLTTLLASTLCQLSLSLVWQKSFYGFSAASAWMLLSWLFGTGAPAWVRWLPGSQAMLFRHTFFAPEVPGFSMAWTWGYNLLFCLAAFLLGAYTLRHTDIVPFDPR